MTTLLIAVPTLADEPLRFDRDIRPILSDACFQCHGPDEQHREADLRLDVEAAAKAERDGRPAILPGSPDGSAIIARLESKNPDELMPPPASNKKITPEQRAVLRRWIAEGASWGRHWSYEPVARPSVPTTAETHPVDSFLAKRLSYENLAFSAEAESHRLMRRVALDLTGLPPTPEELERLLPSNNQAFGSKEYERVVDHYLAQPAFGEHWARLWLDLARYADSAGYPSDPGREIWAYRDWVIKALNSNMRFDQFTVEQLAGDLLPNPTDDQLTATAFHRNTMTNNEGGTDDEEFRNAAVIDRVNTTFAVWMGTTLACAQCHTHKYDPITIDEYYGIYDFFNQTTDADKKDESPLHELVPAEVKRERAAWKAELTAIEAEFANPPSAWLTGFEKWLGSKPAIDDAKLKAALAEPPEKRTAAQTKSLQQHYARRVAAATESQRKRIDELNDKLAATKPVVVPIMQDLPPEKHRRTFVQLRGNWQSLGREVQAGVPGAFPPLPGDARRDRLALARWLVSRDNPLTARVTVNRFWEALFGVGIVRSSEEFGSQGDPPFHPELLDWLAAEFMDSGWDVKHLLKLLVTSRAYRQTSQSTPTLNERDPDNRLLARGPRFRPTGEQLRDQALAVSGLLSSKMYGPPVRPSRPNLGLNTAFGGSNDWTVSNGEDRLRRSIYTETKRNSPYPSFTTFDAPNREVCTIRRGRSNTPLQAFVTLNDPVFVEAHQAMARRIAKESPGNALDRLRLLYRLCLVREPEKGEQRDLLQLHDELLAAYRADLPLAQKMAGERPLPDQSTDDIAEIAAWTAVAGVVMNLDEFLMRP